MSPRILLLGADGNAGMNYAKCIKKQWPDSFILGTGFNKYHLEAAFQGGYVDDVIISSDWDDKKLFYVQHLIERHRINFVHAQPEEEVRWVAENKSNIPAKTGNVDLDVLGYTEDKYSTASILGEKCYEWQTLTYDQFNELADLGSGKVWIRATSGAGSKWALPVTSFQDATSWTAYLRGNKGAHSRDFILSPYLPGREFACQILIDSLGVFAALQSRERLEHHFAKQMVSGQSSTPSVAKVCNDDAVNIKAVKTVQAFNFKPGIYGIDMRMDAQGLPHVTEINYGRYFTTIDFFAEAGLNIPAIEIDSILYGKSTLLDPRSLSDDLYWIRGLDKSPQLVREKDLNW